MERQPQQEFYCPPSPGFPVKCFSQCFNLSCCELNFLSWLLFPQRTGYSLPLHDSFLFEDGYLYIFLCFQLHIPVLSMFPPLWTIFFYSTLSWSAVPSPAVFLPVLGRTEGLINVSETLFFSVSQCDTCHFHNSVTLLTHARFVIDCNTYTHLCRAVT